MFEQEKQKWDKLKTVRDFFKFVEDPKLNISDWFIELCDLKKRSSWISARVDFDINITEFLNSKPQIGAYDISKKTRTPSDIRHHEKYGYTI